MKEFYKVVKSKAGVYLVVLVTIGGNGKSYKVIDNRKTQLGAETLADKLNNNLRFENQYRSAG